MGHAEAEIGIAKSPDDVWAIVRDFGGLAGWMPGVETCRMEGDDDRVIEMMGMEITERRFASDDAAHQLSYGVVAGAPLEQHKVTITVAPEGNGSKVTWAVDVDDAMTEMMGGMYQQALEALKAKAEG
jgi:carbon monoxide dehydrogenase subunit G